MLFEYTGLTELKHTIEGDTTSIAINIATYNVWTTQADMMVLWRELMRQSEANTEELMLVNGIIYRLLTHGATDKDCSLTVYSRHSDDETTVKRFYRHLKTLEVEEI